MYEGKYREVTEETMVIEFSWKRPNLMARSYAESLNRFEKRRNGWRNSKLNY